MDRNVMLMPNTWSEWLMLVNVLLTAVFAALTVFILRANRAAVTAMRDQMANQNRPYVQVSVRVRLGEPVLQLLVKNVGHSAAESLRLHLDRDFFQFGHRSDARNLAKQSAFTQRIESFPPTAELLFDLGVGHEIFAPQADPAISPRAFVVGADYQHGDSAYAEETHIDLNPYIGTSIAQPPVVAELKRVADAVTALSSTTKQIAAAVSLHYRAEGKE